MQPNSKVLIIEDTQTIGDQLANNFNKEFTTHVSQNLEQALLKSYDWEPNVIIIDVNLAIRNGYEVCDEFKQDAKTSETPIIFYSEKDSLRERMLGYEVGAVDFFHKDSPIEEVKAKLNAIAKQSQKAKALKDTAVSAEKTAMEALATTSELGKAVRYVEQSYEVAEFENLAQLLTQFCRDLDLNAVVMFQVRRGNYFYSSNGENTAPIERDLIQRLHSADRFVDFGCRTLTNYPQVSLLVKNMPIDNRERYGRLKDTIPFVLGATDAKVRMLDAEGALTAHCASLTSSVEAAQLTLDTVQDDFQRNLEIVETIMNELSSTMEMDIEKMNMDEADEDKILALVESTSKKLHIILQEHNQTDKILNDLVDLLEKLTQQQSKIIVETLAHKPDEGMDYQSDIELF